MAPKDTIAAYVSLNKETKNDIIQEFLKNERIKQILGTNLPAIETELGKDYAYNLPEPLRTQAITAQLTGSFVANLKNSGRYQDEYYTILMNTINKVTSTNKLSHMNYQPQYMNEAYGGRRRKTRKTRHGKTRKHRRRTSSR
jgi:hypothetical protein